jgi:hypothetical protein
MNQRKKQQQQQQRTRPHRFKGGPGPGPGGRHAIGRRDGRRKRTSTRTLIR